MLNAYRPHSSLRRALPPALTLSLTLALLLAAGLLAGCDLRLPGQAKAATPEPTPVSGPQNVVAEGNLVPRDFSNLGFLMGGRVAEVLVAEGDQVSAGTVLARLSDRESLEAAIAAAELEQLSAQQALDQLNEKAVLARDSARQALAAAEKAAIQAQQALDDLDTSDYQEKLDEAWIDVTEAADELNDAQDELDKYTDLDKDNATRKQAQDEKDDAQKKYDDLQRAYALLKNGLEQARADLALAQARQADAQAELDARQSGPDRDDLALAEARLANARKSLAAAQAALEHSELTAPYAGTIVELNLTVGELVAPNQPVVLLADLSEWYLETSDLTEMDVARVEPGQLAQVSLDALPEVELTAVVESISQGFKERRGDITYTVRLRLTGSDSHLRWGMTAKVDFEAK